ncbi:MAG TPA: SPASM domain-containing protein [Verrucomicrobiae bacterium]|jgi:radical SAM protein with 4Fe4S-binding SPASM domain|nr:SPASM domain-containing protein [Verrucomicrobiae bacterium]
MDIPLFKIILIETLNICTRKCWFCKFGQERQDGTRSEMDWPTIDRILENLRDLDYRGRISWFWINEPLMDKRLPEILKLTKSRCPRAFVSLVTNGDLLSQTRYEVLRQNGLDALGVSIYDDETHAKIRPLRRHGVVMLDMRGPGPVWLENRAGSVKQHAAFFENDKKRFLRRSCDRPFTGLTINARGQAVLCCSDMYSDVAMGDVKEQRLEEIWRGERFNQYRRRLEESGRKGLKLCEDCSYSGKGYSIYYPLPRLSRYIKMTGDRMLGVWRRGLLNRASKNFTLMTLFFYSIVSQCDFLIFAAA